MGQTRSDYHLYGKPGNSGENSNETDHPGGNFPLKKGNTFRGIPFFSLLTETSEIFCFIIVWFDQCQASF